MQTLKEILPQGRARISYIERWMREREGNPVIDPAEAAMDDEILEEIQSVVRGCRFKSAADKLHLDGVIKLVGELRTQTGVIEAVEFLLMELFIAETKARYR